MTIFKKNIIIKNKPRKKEIKMENKLVKFKTNKLLGIRKSVGIKQDEIAIYTEEV